MTSTYTCGPREAPRVQVGLNRPTDCSGIIASLICSHSRGQGGRRSRQDVSPSMHESDLQKMNRPPAFLLGPIHMGKWETRAFPRERFGALCHRHPIVERSAPGGVPRIQEPAGMAPPPCSVRPPHVGPGPGGCGVEDTGLLLLFSL